jgi:hypothetical protein
LDIEDGGRNDICLQEFKRSLNASHRANDFTPGFFD